MKKLTQTEVEKVLSLEDTLHKRVVGQDEAVTLVSEAIIRTRSGLGVPGQPLGCFLFLGPTGVGKTELAKSLCVELFDDEKNMVRIDMVRFQIILQAHAFLYQRFASYTSSQSINNLTASLDSLAPLLDMLDTMKADN